MEQEELLEKLANILNRLKIPYFVTGGLAVSIWGRPRFTADIDVLIHLMPQNLDSLADELLKIGEAIYLDKEIMRQVSQAGKGEFNLIHPESGLKIDFWILNKNRFDQERMQRRKTKSFNKTKIFFSSPEDLILIKLQWHKETASTRQLEDIESIMKIQKELDVEYIEKWAKKQGTYEIFQSLI